MNGKITRIEETLSDETQSDLAAFLAAPLGMPVTGSTGISMALWALVLALLSLVAGVITRRTYAFLIQK